MTQVTVLCAIQRMIDRNPKIRYAIDKAIDYVISLGG